MSNGKTHAVVGICSCVGAWLGISLVHLYWSGLFIAIMFGAILAKFPDLDHDIHIIWGHRSPLFHSALLPEVALLISIFMQDFTALQISIYWCIVQASHLLADLDGKKLNCVSMVWLFWNSLILVFSGVLAGVFLLV